MWQLAFVKPPLVGFGVASEMPHNYLKKKKSYENTSPCPTTMNVAEAGLVSTGRARGKRRIAEVDSRDQTSPQHPPMEDVTSLFWA